MAAPTAYNQLQLATTNYTDLVALAWLPGAPQFIVHQVFSSLTHPSKFMSRGPAFLEGALQTAGSNVTTYLAALQTQTERHASWIGPNAVAVYAHVYAAEITSMEYVAGGPWGSPANTKLVRIGFKFVCPDQRLYLYSSDAALVGA